MKFSLPLELKTSDVSRSGEFVGYAAAFGNIDLGGDVILRGAFDSTLAEHKARGVPPALLWSHDPRTPIGRIVEIREDTKGLYIKARLTLDARAAAEAYALLKDGAVGGMSIGYSIPEGGAEYRSDARLLKQVDLYEVSLVAVPMNPESRVTAVKALDCETKRDLERLLRERLSLSSSKAVKAAGVLWPILNDRDGQDDDRDDRNAADIQGLKAIASELTSLSQLLKGN